jgi:chromosome segregation ATPase
LYRRRSSTFTTYQIQQPSESESFFTGKRIHSVQKRTPTQKICQECLHRDNLIENEHQRLVRAYDENEKLSKELRTSVVRIRQYQEENSKLKEHLMKLNTRLQEYQINFNLLQQKMPTEKVNKPKQDLQVDQLRRLRHELQVYNQVVAAKRQEEQNQIDFYSYRDLFHRK